VLARAQNEDLEAYKVPNPSLALNNLVLVNHILQICKPANQMLNCAKNAVDALERGRAEGQRQERELDIGCHNRMEGVDVKGISGDGAPVRVAELDLSGFGVHDGE
jgi:hypothetical protein